MTLLQLNKLGFIDPYALPKPENMTKEELKFALDHWPPYMRPAYGWASASVAYYKRRNRYIDELMKRYESTRLQETDRTDETGRTGS